MVQVDRKPLIMLAYFYEGNGLLIDAGTHYVRAIEMSPQVTDFKELYKDFKSPYTPIR